jgi:hypothetical protein
MKQTLKEIIAEHGNDIVGDDCLLLKGYVSEEGDRENSCVLYRSSANLIALQEEEGYSTVVWPEQYYKVIGLIKKCNVYDFLDPKGKV